MTRFGLFLVFMSSPVAYFGQAFGMEPPGIFDFMVQQQPTAGRNAPAPLRQQMLHDFGRRGALDPFLDFEDNGAADGEIGANYPQLTTLEEDLAAIMNAPKSPRPGHEVVPYTEDQETVLRYLFGSEYWNKPNHPKRSLRKMLPADILLKLRLIAANPGKKAAVITHAYNAERVRQGREASQDRQVISHFLRDFNEKGWLEYEGGIFRQLLPNGKYALEVLEREARAGRLQQNLTVQKAPIRSKKAKPNLTPEEKVLQDISRPEYYLALLGVLGDDVPRSVDSVREALKKLDMPDPKAKKRLIKHLNLYIEKSVTNKWLELDEETSLYAITAMGKTYVEPLRRLKEKIDHPEQVTANQAPLPEVNLRNLRHPLMHFLVLKVASTQRDFITLDKFKKCLKVAYIHYTGEEMPDAKVRNVSEYTKKQTNDLHWFISRKNGVSLEYKVKPEAVETYLEDLMKLASPSFKKELRPQDPGNKRQTVAAQNDMEEVVEAGQEVQGAPKKAKASLGE